VKESIDFTDLMPLVDTPNLRLNLLSLNAMSEIMSLLSSF
jgi:hypothetical protein